MDGAMECLKIQDAHNAAESGFEWPAGRSWAFKHIRPRPLKGFCQV